MGKLPLAYDLEPRGTLWKKGRQNNPQRDRTHLSPIYHWSDLEACSLWMRKEGRIIIQVEEKKKRKEIRMDANPECQGTAKNFSFITMAQWYPKALTLIGKIRTRMQQNALCVYTCVFITKFPELVWDSVST